MSSPDNPHTDPAGAHAPHAATAETVRTPPSEESLRRGHETRDVNIRAVIWLAVGIAGVTLFSGGVLWLLLVLLQADATRADPELSPLARERVIPPLPHLQDTPNQDYAAFRKDQQALLESYGWADKKRKTVRIPVSRAMDLVLERGMPKPSQEEKAESDRAKEGEQ